MFNTLRLHRGSQLRWFVYAIIAYVPNVAQGCSVCFGAAGDPMTEAVKYAVLCMIAIITCVLSGFGVFFIHLVRKSNMNDSSKGDM